MNHLFLLCDSLGKLRAKGMAGCHIKVLYFLTFSVQFSRKHLEHFPEFLNCVCEYEYPETWSKIYCPSASSLRYPGPGPVSGLTPLAHWNLSRNQKRGISELSMTLVTSSRLATSTYTRPLSVPRQNHPWNVMQISECGEAGSYQWWRFIYNWHHQSLSSLWPQ